HRRPPFTTDPVPACSSLSLHDALPILNLAVASNAMVVGFNVRPSAEARQLAEREGVEIRTYRVIYQLTDDIEQALVGMLRPVTTDRKSTRLNSSHQIISYAVFCLKKKN